MKYCLLILFSGFSFFFIGQGVLTIDEFKVPVSSSINIELENETNRFMKVFKRNKEVKKITKPKNKFIASALVITLGPFGVHRLYLGTSPNVPLVYTLTLGGGFFVLPVIDLFYILTNKNPDNIEYNKYFFIWNKKQKKKKDDL